MVSPPLSAGNSSFPQDLRRGPSDVHATALAAAEAVAAAAAEANRAAEADAVAEAAVATVEVAWMQLQDGVL